MEESFALLATYGYPAIFVFVLFEQSGIPVPSFPAVVLAGAMLASGAFSLAGLVLTIFLADVIPSFGWYSIGRYQGRKVLSFLCRISLTPDVCIRQTEITFADRGAKTIVIAKFIPGLALVTPPLAGMMGYSRKKFIALNTLGLSMYSGLALSVGFIFHASIGQVLVALGRLGHEAIIGAVILFAIYISWKWVKRRIIKGKSIERITVQELGELMSAHAPLLLIDVRSHLDKDAERLPTALIGRIDRNGEEFDKHPRNIEVVVYCACPNEVSAVKLVRALKKRGFMHVRPLLGGIAAWKESGRTIGHHQEMSL